MITDTQRDGPNRLRQREAEARAVQIHDVTYALSLSLQDRAPDYEGNVTIEFGHREPKAGTFLDFTGQTIELLEVNGQPVGDSVWRSNRIEIEGRRLRDQNTVRIVYRNAYDHTGAGFHQFQDPEDGSEYVYTNFEPYEAHRLFPCFDQPDIRARLQLSVAAPDDWTVIANEAETGRTATADGRAQRRFTQTPPLSTYLFAVVAGPYERFQDRYEDTPLALYCRRSLSQYLDSAEVFTITKQGLAFFSDFFACPYPFSKYDQLFVPEFNAGAMENAGAVTFSERMVFRDPPTEIQRMNRAEVVLHEMAHMWFGDLVTMRWWNDLWLNESFATYMSYLAMSEATRFSRGWQAFNSRMKAWAYHQDQLVTTHPIAGPVPDTDATFLNFDGITYGKGASVLKQLAAAIGSDGFREGMRHYFRTYAWTNTNLSDFLGALEHGAQRDLQEWSRLWIETEGLNTLRPAWETRDGRVGAFTIAQTAPAEHPTLRPHHLQLALIDADASGAPVLRDSIPVLVEGERTVVEAAAGMEAPACVFANDQDHAYAKIALDERSLAFVRERVDRFADPFLRQLLWRTLWDMVRDQQFRSTDYLALVRDKIGAEQELELIESALGNVQAAVARFVPESRRVDEAEAFSDIAWERLFVAPDKDRRIVWARAAITAAQRPQSIARLLELVDKGTGIEGFDLDQDMRWSLVTKQIAHGLADGSARLEVEAERDPSDRGRRAAARARSSAPDAGVKAEEWERFTSDRESSLQMIAAGMSGFVWPHQRELLAPYVERFFDEVRDVFRSRDKDFAQAYFGALLPHSRPEDAVIERAEALLASLGDDEAVLRRTTLEALDDLRRARACRAFAASA